MLNARYIKLEGTMRETLGDFIRRIRAEKGLSLKDVERNSRHKISSGYVSQLENGFVSNPTGAKITALAKGLDVDVKALQEVQQGVKVTETVEYKESIFSKAFDVYQETDETMQKYMERSIESLIFYVESRPAKESHNNRKRAG